jgi:hypothetical protein
VAVQVWPAERFWIKGGVGLGDYVDTGGNSHYGFGGMAAVGVELARGGRFALDISVRGGLVNEEDYKHKLVSVNLGVNWY